MKTTQPVKQRVGNAYAAPVGGPTADKRRVIFCGFAGTDPLAILTIGQISIATFPLSVGIKRRHSDGLSVVWCNAMPAKMPWRPTLIESIDTKFLI